MHILIILPVPLIIVGNTAFSYQVLTRTVSQSLAAKICSPIQDMIEKFIQKKKRTSETKLINIENIRSILSSENSGDSSDIQSNDLHLKTETKTSDEGPATITGSANSAVNQFDSVKERKLNLVTGYSLNIPYSLYNCKKHLPDSYRKLSSLYKIINTTYKFNKLRGMSLIFDKYKESIERLWKENVKLENLEQLYFLLGANISFIPVKIKLKGVDKTSFTIKIICEVDIDEILFKHYLEEYSRWLSINQIEGRIIRVHPDFVPREIPLRPLLAKTTIVQEEPLRVIAKSKASSILERIRERERLRKEAFIKLEGKKIDYKGKIENIFAVSRKKAMKLADLQRMLGGANLCGINDVFGDAFYLKTIGKEEYVVKNIQSKEKEL